MVYAWFRIFAVVGLDLGQLAMAESCLKRLVFQRPYQQLRRILGPTPLVCSPLFDFSEQVWGLAIVVVATGFLNEKKNKKVTLERQCSFRDGTELEMIFGVLMVFQRISSSSVQPSTYIFLDKIPRSAGGGRWALELCCTLYGLQLRHFERILRCSNDTSASTQKEKKTTVSKKMSLIQKRHSN